MLLLFYTLLLNSTPIILLSDEFTLNNSTLWLRCMYLFQVEVHSAQAPLQGLSLSLSLLNVFSGLCFILLCIPDYLSDYYKFFCLKLNLFIGLPVFSTLLEITEASNSRRLKHSCQSYGR